MVDHHKLSDEEYAVYVKLYDTLASYLRDGGDATLEALNCDEASKVDVNTLVNILINVYLDAHAHQLGFPLSLVPEENHEPHWQRIRDKAAETTNPAMHSALLYMLSGMHDDTTVN
jgi:hypothetical protein